MTDILAAKYDIIVCYKAVSGIIVIMRAQVGGSLFRVIIVRLIEIGPVFIPYLLLEIDNLLYHKK